MRFHFLASAAGLIICAWAVTAHAAIGTITRIPGLSSTSGGYAYGINDAGTAVGSAGDGTGNIHVMRFPTGGPMQDLGTLGGKQGVAFAINSAGALVGEAQLSNGQWRAFRYSGAGPMENVGTLGGIVSHASDINSSGVVVGFSSDASNQTRAFRYSGAGPMQDLGTLGGHSYANAINAAGVIVGEAYVDNTGGPSHAFRYTDASAMQDLGTLGGSYSVAYGINTAGTIVGKASTLTGAEHAFRYTSGGGMIDLGTIGGNFSAADDINDLGAIVGQSTLPSSAIHATLWKPSGAILDVDAWFNSVNPTEGPKWELTALTKINSDGLASGYGFYNDGSGNRAFGFILDVSSQIPEPSGAPLMTLAVAAMFRRRTTRSR